MIEHPQQHWFAKHGHESAVRAISSASCKSSRQELVTKLTKFGDEYHELIGVRSVNSNEKQNRKFIEFH
jgi:hypothetical protein